MPNIEEKYRELAVRVGGGATQVEKTALTAGRKKGKAALSVAARAGMSQAIRGGLRRGAGAGVADIDRLGRQEVERPKTAARHRIDTARSLPMICA
jgi:hypothetical protein